MQSLWSLFDRRAQKQRYGAMLSCESQTMFNVPACTLLFLHVPNIQGRFRHNFAALSVLRVRLFASK